MELERVKMGIKRILTARHDNGSDGRMMNDGPVISETSSGNVHPTQSQFSSSVLCALSSLSTSSGSPQSHVSI
jgi:hypothetical protein